MKKVLFLALAAAAVMSCSESEEIENAGQKAEIKLGTVVGNTTRATVTDLPELQKMPHSGKLWQQFNGGVVLFRISVYITPHHMQWNIPTGAESFAKSRIPFTFRSSQLVIDVHSGDGEVERLCQLQQTPQQTNTICTA